jgi:DNA polymerase/3'-5' exonuclease PolX
MGETTTAVAEKQRVPLAEAEAVARDIVARYAHACERIEIAGSIRRGRAMVADVEIVAVPKTEPAYDLFGNEHERFDLLHDRCESDLLSPIGPLAHRPDKHGRPAFGHKFKRLIWEPYGVALPLDLFSTTADQFGAIFAIRTGCAAFSKRLVTSVLEGGCMPIGMKQRDGSLWDGGREIPTPTEQAFFDAIGVEMLDPRARTEHAVPRRLARGGR